MAAQDEAAADVEVAKRVEAMLKHEGLNLKGSSDASAWASPSEFWQDASYRKTWYTKAIAYWENNEEVPTTVDGVLGGFASLDAPDVRASRRFLAQARAAAGQGGAFAAADVSDRARIKISWRLRIRPRLASTTARTQVAAAAFVVAGFLDLRVNSGERVNILWQLPQLFLITVAEILVSVTGLEYSYEKAPEAMRASVSALYLLTTAVGDLMGGFLFVAAGHLGVSRPAVLFLCAVLVLLTAVAFRVVARKHFDGFETKPVQTEEDPAEELQAVENVLLRG